MKDIYIKTENLSKRFFIFRKKNTAFQTLRSFIKGGPLKTEFWALRNLSFEIKKGEKLAIIGKNGSGKTTFLRILTGIYDKTSGHLKIEKQPSALFKFWIGLNGDLSVIDNIYLFGAVHYIKRDILESSIDKILEMAELYHLRYCPVRELSVGQMQRLAFTVFFQNTNDFLIFDESMAFIDTTFAQKCHSYFQDLSNSEKTVIMVSHDSAFLRRYCDRAIWLEGGELRASGRIEEVIDEYEKRSIR